MALSLPALDGIEREKLVDSQGVSFKEFRRTLKPSYQRVWFDICAGWGVLICVVVAIVALDLRFPRAFPITALLGGFCIGYVMAFLNLFFHEAAHFNLAKSRKINDFLANAALGWVLGESISAYRLVHMDHHRMLGETGDTEHTYFDALNLRALVEALTGIKLLRVLLARAAHVSAKTKDRAVAAQPTGKRAMLVIGLLLNLAIIGASAWSHCWSLFFAWPMGIIVFLPAMIVIRQTLEHRSFDARSSIDYGKEAHGANTRMFGSGPIASTLGGAGFNRHLLHHWEPQISYTNLKQVESFLLDTQVARPVIQNATTTYARALWRLLNAP